MNGRCLLSGRETIPWITSSGLASAAKGRLEGGIRVRGHGPYSIISASGFELPWMEAS